MTSENWENTAKAKEAESEPAMLRDRLASEYGILIEQYKSEFANQLAQSHEKYQRLNDKRQEERFFGFWRTNLFVNSTTCWREVQARAPRESRAIFRCECGGIL